MAGELGKNGDGDGALIEGTGCVAEHRACLLEHGRSLRVTIDCCKVLSDNE